MRIIFVNEYVCLYLRYGSCTFSNSKNGLLHINTRRLSSPHSRLSDDDFGALKRHILLLKSLFLSVARPVNSELQGIAVF